MTFLFVTIYSISELSLFSAIMAIYNDFPLFSLENKGNKEMSVKERVLLLLEENKNTPLSGEEIAEQLQCTRAAVWKAVKTLQGEGYKIEGVNNKGYTLKTSPDVLSKAFIEEKVRDAGFDIEIITKPSVDSTNTQLKAMASAGKANDCVMIAEEQTAGKGRRGRSFYSPSNTGIYISFLLHPHVPVYEASTLTTLSATAEAIAIENVLKYFNCSSSAAISENKSDDANTDSELSTCQSVQIKWVNDIYMRGKKVSGILTEASTSIEDGTLEFAVPGIGINLYEPEGGFPEEIKNVAGAVFADNIQRENLRNMIASELIINFLKFYYDVKNKTDIKISSVPQGTISRSYIEEYKKRSIVIGKEVTILTPDHEQIEGPHSKATVVDINDDCHLLLRYEDGTEEFMSSGEISVRM